MGLLVFEGGGEGVEDDGVGSREDESVLAVRGGVEEESIFYFAVVVGDIFFDDGVLERGDGLFDLHIQFVTYNKDALLSK